ncbi:MAG: hypothetical protein AB8B69_18970 [Chitinophagales bacterium]
MVRGGSWNYVGYNCRVASRSRSDDDIRDSNIGCRLVRY